LITTGSSMLAITFEFGVRVKTRKNAWGQRKAE